MYFTKLLIWFCISFLGLYLIHLIIRNVCLKLFNGQLTYGQCYIIATCLVSTIQAIVVSTISTRFFVTCQDILHDNDPLLESYVFPLSAYFIYDILVMYQGHLMTTSSRGLETFWARLMDFIRQKPSLVFHHLLMEMTGVPVVFFLRRRGFGLFFIAGFFIAELSTPFHNIRSILLTVGIKNGFIYNINGLMFLLTFFGARVSMVPYLYYRFAKYKEINCMSVPWEIPLHCNIASASFFLLQVYWFSLILRNFIKTLVKLNSEYAGKDKIKTR